MASAKKTSANAARGGDAKNETKIAITQFHGMLILAQWAMSFFQGGSFAVLQRALNRTELEGIDAETGQTRFFHELTNTLIDLNTLPLEMFRAYDLRIVGYWRQITEKRNEEYGGELRMKYFQYLTLLVTELYLDWYFNRRMELLAELNRRVAVYNEAHPKAKDRLPEVLEGDLNKVSFWEATGAGKTLLLHINILQYDFYARQKPAKKILLTPNEGLSNQHLRELELSGIPCELMAEGSLSLHSGTTVGVVDAGKLISDDSSRKQGEKSFMAEAFEGNNLVLVDEGHNGSSKADGERRKVREQICRDGFSFEYSATFGQAVAPKNAIELRSLYARNILFDYSYRYFYEDGYGKEAFILNMPDPTRGNRTFEYLCGNLLSYYQQHHLYAKNPDAMGAFGIEKPLCVFVGNTVNATNEDELSDVRTILEFLAKVLSDRETVEKLFQAFIGNEPILPNAQGNNLMRNAFTPLLNSQGAEVYEDMLRRLFNVDAPARLKVTYLKSPGEIMLAVGTGKPFALIRIGDSDAFIKGLGTAEAFDVEPTDNFSVSHFDRIDAKDSPISFLVGSRKFTEGWSSWRVSSMGLLNMGVSEGTQIIQLFGRGVRLKGRGFSLKRSVPTERPKDCFLEKLETLNIFGIRANYMENFRKYLEAEGVHTQDEVITLHFPVKKQAIPAGLRVPQVKDGYRLNQTKGFKTKALTLFEISETDRKRMKEPHVVYDDYAYVQMLRTQGSGSGANSENEKQEVKLDRQAFEYFDWDRIYRNLLRVKGERGYWNLKLEKKRLMDFCRGRDDWYTLFSRPVDATFDSFDKLSGLERLFEILLHGYLDRFYKAFQALYEEANMEMVALTADRMPDEYLFEITNSDEGGMWIERLETLKALVAENAPPAEINKWSRTDFVAIAFEQHLYSPLLYSKNNAVLPFTMKPITFDSPSECLFVQDLMGFYQNANNRTYFEDVDLYLMRNASSKARGIGFASAGNFYPDFLLWLVDKKTGRQHLTFIDPKGLRNVKRTSSKLLFASEIKKLQASVTVEGQPSLTLNSIILSVTPCEDLLFEGTQEELEKAHVLFLSEGGVNYLPKLLAICRKP